MATEPNRYPFVVEIIVPWGTVTLGRFAECTLRDRALSLSAVNSAGLKDGEVNARALSLVAAMSARPALLVTEVSDHGTDRTWRLAGAQVTNYVGPTLNAEGPNVIEELSLTVDSITIA